MTATATAIDNFEKTLRQHVAKKVGNAATLLEQIKKVKSIYQPVYEEDKIKVFLKRRAKALNVLADNLFVAKLSAQYPLLDNKIFSLKRHLSFQNDVVVKDVTTKPQAAHKHIEMALFVHVAVGTKKVVLGKHRIGGAFSEDGGYVGLVDKIVTFSAAVPTVPLEVAELGRKALGFYHTVVAEIYNNPHTSDLHAVEALPTLETMWIPTVESINVKVDKKIIPAPKSYDPALLLKHRDHYYLVGLWDIKEELPFEHILREFTVGHVQFPKKVSVS